MAAKLAEKAGADYRMLHLPDNLSANVLEEMKSEPEVAETIDELKRVDILLLGVGDAVEMAEKRRLDNDTCKLLRQEHAVAEACGYYFNHKGEVVYETNSIGVDFEEVHPDGACDCFRRRQKEGSKSACLEQEHVQCGIHYGRRRGAGNAAACGS